MVFWYYAAYEYFVFIESQIILRWIITLAIVKVVCNFLNLFSCKLLFEILRKHINCICKSVFTKWILSAWWLPFTFLVFFRLFYLLRSRFSWQNRIIIWKLHINESYRKLIVFFNELIIFIEYNIEVQVLLQFIVQLLLFFNFLCLHAPDYVFNFHRMVGGWFV